MNRIIVTPGQGKGLTTLPPSKSHTQRAILFALMAEGVSVIRNYLDSPDTLAMLSAIEKLGAKVLKKEETVIEILGTNGKLKPAEDVIYAGNSGQVLRFIGAFSALIPSYTVITGDLATRTNRVITPLLDGIQQLGGFAESARQNGTAPILIKGPIFPGKVVMSGACSQPVSALLMAASFLPGPTEIIVEGVQEKPWLALTLYWMKKLGLSFSEQNLERFTVAGRGKYSGFDVFIPGDLSSAAFPAICAIITKSTITLQDFDRENFQGDGKLFTDLANMGVKMEHQPLAKTLTIYGDSSFEGGILNVDEYIDAIPILSVLGCFAKNPLTLMNAGGGRKKESDRLFAITKELRKMGAEIQEEKDQLHIFPSKLFGAELDSWQDHRIAMACISAGLAAEGKTTVNGVECIEKSYPNFYKEFCQLGFKLA
jgi:3-phosphoshikimate 1-carboxyvinyltransferase